MKALLIVAACISLHSCSVQRVVVTEVIGNDHYCYTIPDSVCGMFTVTDTTFAKGDTVEVR